MWQRSDRYNVFLTSTWSALFTGFKSISFMIHFIYYWAGRSCWDISVNLRECYISNVLVERVKKCVCQYLWTSVSLFLARVTIRTKLADKEHAFEPILLPSSEISSYSVVFRESKCGWSEQIFKVSANVMHICRTARGWKPAHNKATNADPWLLCGKIKYGSSFH